MRARVALGATVVIVGLFSFGIGLYNFNTLFFQSSSTSAEHLPTYAESVVAPVFLGILIVLDGLIVISWKSIWALIPFLIGNALWAYATYNLIILLAKAETVTLSYQSPFMALAGGILLFIIVDAINGAAAHRR